MSYYHPSLLLQVKSTSEDGKQKLYPHQALGRELCAPCNDTTHKYCEGYGCACPCRDPKPCKPRIKRNRNGLTEEGQRDQIGFPFDEYEALDVGNAMDANAVRQALDCITDEEGQS